MIVGSMERIELRSGRIMKGRRMWTMLMWTPMELCMSRSGCSMSPVDRRKLLRTPRRCGLEGLFESATRVGNGDALGLGAQHGREAHHRQGHRNTGGTCQETP